MRFIKFLRNYPFLLLLILSTIILTITGMIGRNSIYSDFSISLLKTPRLAVVFEGIGEGIYPWMKSSSSGSEENSAVQVFDQDHYKDELDYESNKNSYADNTGKVGSAISVGVEDLSGTGISTDMDYPDQDGDASDSKESTSSDQEKTDVKASDSKASDDAGENGSASVTPDSNDQVDKADDENDHMEDTSGKQEDELKEDPADDSQAQETSSDTKNNKPDDSDAEEGEPIDVCRFEKVTEDYFNDALFIGDSRTVGLSEYSGWKNPTFYADEGMSIYDIFKRKAAELNGNMVTIPEALSKKKFSKIYIMLGINELGTGTADTFVEEYKKVIDQIQELQPTAIVFIEGIMNVSKEKSDKDPIFNNTNIKERNDHLAKLADNKSIFYIDVNEAITDQSGNLPSKYTFDYIHLKAAYYKIWTEFLIDHGITRSE
jgi:hypothetical protein